MPETQTQQPNAPHAIRKQPLTSNFQFVPQSTVRRSPIPERFSGEVPIIVPGAISGNVVQR